MSSTPDKRTRDILKEYFETGDRPKEIEFSRLIDSGINQKDDGLYAENGNIGIGTANPLHKLQVEGDAKITTNAIVNEKLGVQTDAPMVELQVGNGIKKVGLGSVYDATMGWGTSYIGFNAVRIPNSPSSKNWFIASDTANNGGAAIYSNVGGDLYFATVPSDSGNGIRPDKLLTDEQILDARRVTIKRNGNVGIGEIEPQNKLEIKGIADTGLRLPTGKGQGKILTSDANGNAIWRPATDITDNLWRKLGNPNHIGNGNTGNVGIGVSDPTEKLEVNGSLQLNGNLYGRNSGGEFLIHAVKDARGGAYMHLRSSDYVGANGNQGGISFVARKGTANPKQNGFVFQQHNPLESPEWPRCLTIDGNRDSYYHNNKIYLRDIGDQNHGLAYFGSDKGNFNSVDVNGPVLFGYNGGALGARQGTSSSIALRWTYDHKVGIGVPNPQYMLHVGSKLENYSGHYRWWKKDGDRDGFYSGSSQNIPISIYATGRILCNEFNAYSDERIKNIIGISDAKKDLEKLAKIEITDYTMKDRLAFSDRLQKKLIGQRLKEVFPEAVSLNPDYVPNIYKTSEVKDGKILLEGKYNVGDRIKLFTKDEEILAQILSYENGILSVDKVIPDGEVFIYGTEVKDFHVVDYNAVAMLNVSATQELLRMVQEQQLEINQLKQQISAENKH